MQVSSDLARPAAHVASRPYVPHTGGKSVQKMPVKWFVLELIEDAPDVFVGYRVVARFDVDALWIRIRHFPDQWTRRSFRLEIPAGVSSVTK